MLGPREDGLLKQVFLGGLFKFNTHHPQAMLWTQTFFCPGNILSDQIQSKMHEKKIPNNKSDNELSGES